MDMRNLILVGALALLVLSPLTAVAQQKAAPVQAAVPPTIEGVSTYKLLAIGLGAIFGAAATQAIVGGEAVALVGGIAGGFVGAWWYDNSNGGPVRAAMREPAGAPTAARAERLALAR